MFAQTVARTAGFISGVALIVGFAKIVGWFMTMALRGLTFLFQKGFIRFR